MDFRIAHTFTDSLSRLISAEQKAVKNAAFDLQLNPTNPGLSFHKLDRARDSNFWSVRVNIDIRLIIHRTQSSLLLVYVGHHDDAYKWAERRKIQRHPTTGAMQLVVIRERVEDERVAQPPAPKAAPRLFDRLRKPELMAFGVPEEWIDDVRAVTEETLFDLLSLLPQEAQEALLKLAVGERPEPPPPATTDPFQHPDAQRRFRVLTNVEELQRALEFPWEKWAVFLHPAQRQLVERNYGGPARISGSAGTGKTIVALHRAVFLARENPTARVLLTTFSEALANALKLRLDHLTGNEPALAARITVQSFEAVGRSLYTNAFEAPRLAKDDEVRALLATAATETGASFGPAFLWTEWAEIVDAWQLESWDAYRDVARLGRKTRIGVKQREQLWVICERVHAALGQRGLVTWSGVFGRLAGTLGAGGQAPYDFAVVDEAQDLGIAEARFLAALGGNRPNALFFAGDLGQRIFQQPFSWKSLGLDVRGRSFTLRINYRTSHQIRTQADRLLPGAISDVDGNEESRRGTVSVFDGPAPEVRILDTPAAEEASVGAWIKARLGDGYRPEEIGVFVRAESGLTRAIAAVRSAGAACAALTETVEARPGHILIGTMHLAKGLEFRAVAVMACDDDVLPLEERIEAVADESDLEEVYNTERHLLYVACTRARDVLLVTGVAPGSEFLQDLGMAKQRG